MLDGTFLKFTQDRKHLYGIFLSDGEVSTHAFSLLTSYLLQS